MAYDAAQPMYAIDEQFFQSFSGQSIWKPGSDAGKVTRSHRRGDGRVGRGAAARRPSKAHTVQRLARSGLAFASGNLYRGIPRPFTLQISKRRAYAGFHREPGYHRFGAGVFSARLAWWLLYPKRPANPSLYALNESGEVYLITMSGMGWQISALPDVTFPSTGASHSWPATATWTACWTWVRCAWPAPKTTYSTHYR